MEGSIRPTEEERKVLLRAYRSGADARIARRAHIVLLRAAEIEVILDTRAEVT